MQTDSGYTRSGAQCAYTFHCILFPFRCVRCKAKWNFSMFCIRIWTAECVRFVAVFTAHSTRCFSSLFFMHIPTKVHALTVFSPMYGFVAVVIVRHTVFYIIRNCICCVCRQINWKMVHTDGPMLIASNRAECACSTPLTYTIDSGRLVVCS